MARPRKEYGSEVARQEALRKANRDRVKRHREAKAKALESAISNEGLVPIEMTDAEAAEYKRVMDQLVEDRHKKPRTILIDGLECEVPGADG